MKKLTVNASKKYNVIIERGFENFESEILPLIKSDKVAIITDSNVAPLYFDAINKFLENKTVYKFVIKAGEKSKNTKNYLNLINKLVKRGFSRNSLVIGLGGGVVGDLASFVASTYMRGINYIAIPTTLLSMVDSSVGGKTGVDLRGGKNLLGTFYQPNAVYINTDFIKTLPEREVLCGKGEILKYAFIDERLNYNDFATLNFEELIYNCLQIKRDVVESDEKESGRRMLLNFGHTIGHALEKLYNYKLSHGECVIKGMYFSIKASYNLGFIEKHDYDKAINLLMETGVDFNLKFTKNEILSVIKKDKKSDGDSVNFVFTKGFSNAFVKNVPISLILENI